MSSRGFTLIESLTAVAILGIALAGILPSFIHFMDSNTLTEERSESVAAAEQVLEGLRQVDPVNLPNSGSSAVELIRVGDHEFEVVERYCTEPTYCGTDTRHVVVEVSFGGQTIYSVETVFTRLR